MYHKRRRGSRKYTEMAKASVLSRAAKRLYSPAPDYPPELPELRREVIIIDYDFGCVEHRFRLYRSDRIDCYRVEVDGKPLPGRLGWAKTIELARKAFIRVGHFGE